MTKRNSRIEPAIGATLLVAGMWIALAAAIHPGRCALASALAKPSSGKVPASRPVVVVELFTSEGCSSCPPADKMLTWLSGQPYPGIEIIPLSEHVDYWNHLGWADPYSSSVFSERQREYSDSLHTGAYTPQMVVDGKVEFVGGDGNKADQAISSESRAPKAVVRIEAISSAAKGPLSFSVSVEKVPFPDTKKKGVIFFAVTENNLRSSVVGGENSGRTLAHSAVVRELRMIGQLKPGPDSSFTGQPVIEVAKEWKLKDLRAVVFVQLQGSHKILGAAESPFPGY